MPLSKKMLRAATSSAAASFALALGFDIVPPGFAAVSSWVMLAAIACGLTAAGTAVAFLVQVSEEASRVKDAPDRPYRDIPPY